MTEVLSYLLGLLGVALIVAVTVFPAGIALWLAFALAIAVAGTATVLAGASLRTRRRLTGTASTAIAGLGAFLVIAALIFEGVSLGWLQAIAGGAIAYTALGVAAAQSRRPAVSAVTVTGEVRRAA